MLLIPDAGIALHTVHGGSPRTTGCTVCRTFMSPAASICIYRAERQGIRGSGFRLSARQIARTRRCSMNSIHDCSERVKKRGLAPSNIRFRAESRRPGGACPHFFTRSQSKRNATTTLPHAGRPLAPTQKSDRSRLSSRWAPQITLLMHVLMADMVVHEFKSRRLLAAPRPSWSIPDQSGCAQPVYAGTGCR